MEKWLRYLEAVTLDLKAKTFIVGTWNHGLEAGNLKQTLWKSDLEAVTLATFENCDLEAVSLGESDLEAVTAKKWLSNLEPVTKWLENSDFFSAGTWKHWLRDLQVLKKDLKAVT